MLSKNQVKFINSLKRKKIRHEQKLFIAEGVKVVEELLSSRFELFKLYYTDDSFLSHKTDKFERITELDLKNMSELSTPNKVLGIFKIPQPNQVKSNGLTLVLDSINDPGNLGTIIRLCDWFAVDQLVCSTNTVDCFNQKVVQASMGSLSRVSIVYTAIESFLEKDKRIIYGTFLHGENVYKTKLEKEAVLVLGNEANGISKQIEELISSKLNIPQFGVEQKTESLNVATATAILLSEFRR